MTELERILSSLTAGKGAEAPSVLATIIEAHGSTYRRPSARALIHADGSTTGMISGGCLERDLFERARPVFEDGDARVVSYDAQATADIVWGLGLGCPGIVKILLERVERGTIPASLTFMRDTRAANKRAVMATIVDASDERTDVSHIMLCSRDAIERHMHNPEVEAEVVKDCATLFDGGTSFSKQYRSATSSVVAFCEVIEPPLPLLVIGAGPDAMPVVRHAKELGWDVTLIDHRPAFVTPERFPEADACILSDADTFPDTIGITSRHAAIIMTHVYAQDFLAFRSLISSPAKYVGLLGPKSKSVMMLQQLHEVGIDVSDDRKDALHSPAGLDIGAETPEEIALAITSEITAVMTGRTGRYLRDRKAPIH